VPPPRPKPSVKSSANICGSVVSANSETISRGTTFRVSFAPTPKGTPLVGVPYGREALYHLLRNRLYIGEIVHRSNHYPGQHEPILSRELWGQVAAQLAANNQSRRNGKSVSTPSLLSGILFDPRGIRFTPTHAVKNGKRYRYYTSQAAI
jgi:site-specific DNA recombinase